MTLLDAKVYDPAPARRRKIRILVAVVVILVLAAVVWMNRYWSEKRVVDKFFNALQTKDYETAYGIYFADPQWKQHPDKYPRYPLNQFIQDWGAGGQWGVIKSYKVNGASTCGSGGQRGGGGCHRQRPRRACPIVGGKIGQDLEPAALRIALPVV